MSGAGGFYSFVGSWAVWFADGASALGAMVEKLHLTFFD